MDDNTKQAAWQKFCRRLEALGVDPYDPTLPPDDPRHDQVAAIIAEYRAATTHTPALPPYWEGHEPIQPVDSLPELAEWLALQWQIVKGWELAGDKARPTALQDASRAIRNAFRVLAWLGVEDRPERPPPSDDLATLQKQIDDLEQWIRAKHESGWRPSPVKTTPTPAPTTKEHPKRNDIPDDYTANILIKKYLESHPKATIREVSKAVGVSIGRIAKLDAWRREMAEREVAKPLPKKSERQLTDKMLAVMGKKDDPAAKVMLDEAIFRWLLENANQEERATLHMKNAEEKAKLIEEAREQYEQAHANVDD